MQTLLRRALFSMVMVGAVQAAFLCVALPAVAASGARLAVGNAPEFSPIGGLRLVWAYEGGPPPAFDLRSLNVLPGDMLVGECDVSGEVYLLSTDKGELLWKLDLGHRLLGFPAAVSGSGKQLYTIGYREADHLPSARALDRPTGRIVRELPLESREWIVPVRWRFEDGWLFVSDTYRMSMLTAVDLPKWTVAWNWQPPHSPLGIDLSDVVAGKRFVAVLARLEEERTPRVYLLDRISGLLTSTRPVADISRLPRTASIVYLLNAESGAVTAMNLDTGAEVWTFILPRDEVVDDVFEFGDANSGRLLIQTTAPEPRVGSVHLLDATGSNLWSATAESLGMGRREWPGIEWRAPDAVFACLTRAAAGPSVIGVSEDAGRVLWKRSASSLCPELGPAPHCDFVAGEYHGMVLLQLQGSNQLAFASLDPATGHATARVVDPEGIAYAEAGEVISDGRMLYVFDYGARRLVALQVQGDTDCK